MGNYLCDYDVERSVLLIDEGLLYELYAAYAM